MITVQEAERAIVRMVQGTAEGKLTWRRIRPSSSMEAMSAKPMSWSYVTKFRDWHVGAFEIVEREFDPDTESFYVFPVAVVAILYEDNQVAYALPHTAATRDLLQAAQGQAVGARGFIRALLDE